ncbi:MAG: PleD family two-component system response regulator [Desulfobacterales bacterium]|nr:PleD family two-component system response regulator [Desulfobacterales bacterium]
MNMETKKNRILVVDDSEENIDILVSLFQKDYMITAAINGKKALEIASKRPPDLILLDIMMPEMNGYEVCHKLKGNDITKNIPVIFITALSDTLDEAKAFNLGAVDYITKPFQPVITKARVRTHIELKNKTDMLETLVSLDGLTGIFNRRKFDEYLNAEWKRALRVQTHLSLILMDIDHFKQFNDHYGHATGDDCLRKVANELNNVIKRDNDFLARYGGEEFVVILPNTAINGAKHVAEVLRMAITKLNLPHEYSSAASHVSLSLGVASTIPTQTSNLPKALIEAADEMLYKSKKNGRNQVNAIEIDSC